MTLTRSSNLAWILVFAGLPAWGSPPAQGIHNFRQVDSQVYRGGQPDQSGFEYLAKLGVKTILDLREADERSAWEKQTVTALGMKYVNVPMTSLTPPTLEQISQILELLEEGAGAVFVHCKRGADRTGAVIAAYRIDHDNWDNARALKEARADGMRFFQLPRQDFIRKFQPMAKNKPDEATTPVAATTAASVPSPALAK